MIVVKPPVEPLNVGDAVTKTIVMLLGVEKLEVVLWESVDDEVPASDVIGITVFDVDVV